MTGTDSLGRTFDRIAELYHDARPDYPEAIFDDIVAFAGLEAGSHVLEVGAGTGKATLPLARRGLRITTLEPGPALASVLRRNLVGFAGVEVVESTLEAADLAAGSFDLVVAATSWHWVKQPRGYEQVARTLRAGGTLAIFGALHVSTPEDRDFFGNVQPQYLEHAPSLWRAEDKLIPLEAMPDLVGEIEAAGLFEHVETRRHGWLERFDSASYPALLRTFSEHIALSDEQREALLSSIAEVIDRDYGGEITKGYGAILHLARRPS
ncbi:MAG: class I SAM-dependent methyltransferase [Dehalococcoidia bacterium]